MDKRATGNVQNLTYNDLHQMTEVEIVAGITSTYTYDTGGIRVRQQTSAQGTTPATDTIYIGDTVEVDRISGETTTYFYSAGTRVAFKKSTSAEVHYLATDHLTGTSTITDTSFALGFQRQRYTPYGEQRGSTQNTLTTLGYTGQHNDTTTGLKYYNARYYDPAAARFIQADTIIPGPANSQTFNRYSYVSNNPINYSDPTGHCAFGPNTPNICFTHGWFALPTLGFEFTISDENPDRQNAWDSARENAIALYHSTRFPWARPTGGGCSFICDGAEGAANGLFGASEALDAILYPPNWPGIAKDTAACGWSPRDCVSDAIDGMVQHCQAEGVAYCVGEAGPAAVVCLFQRASCFRPDGGSCSFSATTRVLMADGSTKPISEIQIGDWVLAENPETREQGGREVTHLWAHQDTIIDLEIVGHGVATTEDHPFWNATDAEWQRADEFDVGDLVLTAGGDLLAVDGMDRGSARKTMSYNLTVAGIHTYFVMLGSKGVLVHNSCWELSPPGTDTGIKGVHIKVDGVELAVRPGGGGSVVFKPVFSATAPKAAASAIKQANDVLSTNTQFQTRLLANAERSLEYLQGSPDLPGAAGRMAEIHFLIIALGG